MIMMRINHTSTTFSINFDLLFPHGSHRVQKKMLL